MSTSYTLHVAPHAVPGDSAALSRATLVRDGFSLWAFVAGPLWLLWHRHWLAGLALALAFAAFWGLLRFSGLPGIAVFGLDLLLGLLIGLEGSSIRRWDLDRQGRPAVDIVFAASEADAEAKSFARWLAAEDAPLAPPSVPLRTQAAPWALRGEPQVIGMFPDAERRR